jgi:hypothetical protein
MNGHLETLKWIRANGGEWTHWAADWAAWNGHLETLKWIKYVDSGERTEDMRKKLSAEPLVYKDIENTIIAYV